MSPLSLEEQLIRGRWTLRWFVFRKVVFAQVVVVVVVRFVVLVFVIYLVCHGVHHFVDPLGVGRRSLSVFVPHDIAMTFVHVAEDAKHG